MASKLSALVEVTNEIYDLFNNLSNTFETPFTKFKTDVDAMIIQLLEDGEYTDTTEAYNDLTNHMSSSDLTISQNNFLKMNQVKTKLDLYDPNESDINIRLTALKDLLAEVKTVIASLDRV